MRTTRMTLVSVVLGILLAGAAPGQPPPDAAVPEAFEPQGLITVRTETLVIAGSGDRTVGQDEAILAHGKTGLLRLEVPLSHRGADGEPESVSLRIEVTYTAVEATGSQAERAPVHAAIEIHSTARARGSGEIVMRSGGGELDGPGSLFHEAFVSAATGERIIVNLHISPWVDKPEPLIPVVDRAPRPVHYRISLFRRSDQGLEFLGTPELHSLVGRSAYYSFGFVLDSPGEGPTAREELRLEVKGVDLTDGTLAGMVSLQGTLRGTPVDATAAWAVESGQESRLRLELGEIDGEQLGALVVVSASF